MTNEKEQDRQPSSPASDAAEKGAGGPLLAIADFIGNPWFGVATMVLILAYCWLGSAGTQPFMDWFPRQTFEKTEMGWFTWWPFSLLIALFCLSVILATLRRIPLNLPNLGTWTVHLGILVLILGAAIYYGSKQEGDMAVYRRQAVIRIGEGNPLSLILRPGEAGVVEGGGRAYSVRVGTLNPDYELLTGEDKGKRTYAAQLRFQPMGGGDQAQGFIRQLLVGYPQYTEDVVPGQGRAIKVLGKPLVDESVKVDLDYVPADLLYLNEQPAIYARFAGEEEWTEFPIRGLPRYHEFVAQADDAAVPAGESPPRVGKLALSLRPKDPAASFDSRIGLGVRGFLPFAVLKNRWVPGGGRFNPYLEFTLKSGSASLSETLLANDPERQRVSLGNDLMGVSFLWLDEQTQLDELLKPGGVPRLIVEVPGKGKKQEIPLAEASQEPVEIPGTGYSIQLMQLYRHWTLANSNESAQMAVVRVSSPSQSFLRAVVAPHVDLSQDLNESGHMQGGLVDKKIRIEMVDLKDTGLILVGGPVGLHAVLVGEDGSVEHRQAKEGQPVSFFGGQMQVTIDRISETSHRVAGPVIIPRGERDLKAGGYYSMAEVEVSFGSTSRTVWIEHSQYAHSSRAGYYPRTLSLEDGRKLELLFSRQRIRLPTPVALEDFQLEVFPGGTRERDYISLVRFLENGKWGPVQQVHSNHPTEHGGWWYFQSTWDPPDPSRNYGGMNYTGLGVGNRHGVGVMLLGSILTVLGTIWAFYVKPVLLLRRRQSNIPFGEESGEGVE